MPVALRNNGGGINKTKYQNLSGTERPLGLVNNADGTSTYFFQQPEAGTRNNTSQVSDGLHSADLDVVVVVAASLVIRRASVAAVPDQLVCRTARHLKPQSQNYHGSDTRAQTRINQVSTQSGSTRINFFDLIIQPDTGGCQGTSSCKISRS